MRLEEHPVLDFDRGEEVVFYYNGQPITGFTHETIAAALHAAGIRTLGHSPHPAARPGRHPLRGRQLRVPRRPQ